MEHALAWAHAHFWGAKLADIRLMRRLVEVAACILNNPCGTLPQAMESKAAAKGAYRFFANEDVSYEVVLEPHVEHTREACREAGEYLLIEDTTALSFSQRAEIEGLGPMSNKGTQGLFVHTCLAARIGGWTEDHTPQVTLEGLFGQECWVRETPQGTRETRKKAKRKSPKNPIPRESDRWGRALWSTQGPPTGARWTLVADRECDIFDVMAECRERDIGWVQRAAQHRKTYPLEENVFEVMEQAPVLGRYAIKLRARPGVAARMAKVELRSLNVSIRPKREYKNIYEPLQTGLVEVREVDPPDGVEAVHWLLLTNWACATFSEARRVVGVYATRWLIEEYHKALKTGTNIEASQLTTAQRIKSLLAIHVVIAVKLLQMKLVATACPDEAVEEAMIAPESLAVLEIKFGRPYGGWTNDKLMRTIARMGGYLDRKNDGPPGWLSIWRGWKKLVIMTHGYIIATQRDDYG